MTTESQMGTGKISKLVISYSIPAIVGMLVSAAYNIADRMWVGQIPEIGGMALNAIGATLPFATILTACCAFVATGAATTISSYLGKKEESLAAHTVGNAFSLTFILAAIYTIVGLVFLKVFLQWMGVGDAIFAYAADYQKIIFSGSIFQFFSYVIAHSIRSTGNLKRYSLTIVSGAILNIVLDPIFIFGLGLGIKGAAYATNLSALIAALYGLSYYFKKSAFIKLKASYLLLKRDISISILTIGSVSFIFQLLLGLIGGFTNSVLTKYGSLNYLAGGINGLNIGGLTLTNGGEYGLGAMAIVMSLATLFLMPVFGIIQGIQPIISYNFGAKQISRVKETYIFATKYTLLFCTLGLLAIQLFAGPIAGAFTRDSLTIFVSVKSMRIFLIGIPFIAFQLISICLLQSTERVKVALFLTLLRQVFLNVPLLFVLPFLFGFWGVWCAGPTADILSAVVTLFFVIKEYRKFNALLNEPGYI